MISLLVAAALALAWLSATPVPEPRTEVGAAVVRGEIAVVGGLTEDGAPSPRVDAYSPKLDRWRRLADLPVGSGLARRAFALDLRTRRWTVEPAPSPREHLAVTAAGGKIYALGGRRAGYDTNVATFEVWTPGTKRWRRLPPVPEPRGGTGAAVAAGSIVSVGGEAPSGTIASVYAYDLARGRWRRLPDLPTPRHGLGVVGIGNRVYALAGGPIPGLTVSGANEYLDLR